MPILRADLKELAGTRHADIEHLLQLLPEALSGAKAASTVRRYAPLWRYFRDWCSKYDLSFLPAAPLTVALYLLKLAQTANSFATIKMASAAIAAFHSFASQAEVTKAPIVGAMREYTRRALPSGDNRKEPTTFDKVEEACKVLACRSSGRLRNLSLAAAISLGFCGFFRYDDLAHIRVGGITQSSDGASVEILLVSRKNDQYRQGSRILLSAINSYAWPVDLTAILLRHAGLTDGSRPLSSAVSVHDGQEAYGSTPISYQSLRRGVLDVFQEIGLPVQKFGLHSLRAGGATLAANSGVSDRLWMEHGGWRSFRSAVGYVKISSEVKASVTKAKFGPT